MTLSSINWLYLCGLIFEFHVLFLSSICSPLCQYHVGCFNVFLYLFIFLIFEATYFNVHYIQRLSAPLYEICTTTPTTSKVMIWKPVLGNSYPYHAKTGSEFWHENKAQFRLSLISVSLTSLCKIMYCLLTLQQFVTIPSIFPWYVLHCWDKWLQIYLLIITHIYCRTVIDI